MSGYVLTEMQKDLQKFARDFAQKELGPIAAEIDRPHGPFPVEVFRKFCDAGFNTMFLPEAYGGQGFGAFDMVLVNEEFAKVDAGFICSATTGEFGIEPVMLFGTEEQKHYYMDFLLNGKLGAFALTEPDAGSDAGATRTTAVRDGDDYILNGRKCFITSGGLGTMGFGYGAAIGAQMALGNNARVVMLTGDGSFHMNLNEACTAVSYGLPIITVIFNNQVLGMVRQWQTTFYEKRYSDTDPHRRTDFVKLAEGFGAKGYRATTPAEFKAAFADAMQQKGPSWIDCRIGKDEKVLPMIPGGGTINDIIME